MRDGAEIRNNIIKKAEELGKVIQDNSDVLPFDAMIRTAVIVMLAKIQQTGESKANVLRLIEDEGI